MATAAATQTKNKSVLWDWLTTVDHKKLAVLYLIAGTLFFVKAGVMAVLIRIQLMTAENDLISAYYDALYNYVVPSCDTVIVWFYELCNSTTNRCS